MSDSSVLTLMPTGKTSQVKFKKISILMPVFNEEATLLRVLTATSKADTRGLEKQIIIVDDGSTDGTRKILESLDLSQFSAEVYYHAVNQGKGAALRTAQQHVAGDIVIIQDADLEYDPNEFSELIRPIIEDRADVVYGSRLSGGRITRAFKFTHLIGNKFLSFLTNLLYDSTLTDMETCYKAIRTDIFKRIVIKSNRFEFEPEITAKILKQKSRLYELPIAYYGRDYSEGKKITWKDGFGAVWALFKYRFSD